MSSGKTERDLKGGKVLVTGAAGFVGSHLTELLVSVGAKVRAFVRYNSRNSIGNLAFLPPHLLNKVEILPGDLKDFETVLDACKGVDTVFHLGALIGIPYSYKAVRSYIDVNVVGTLNVLEAARRLGLRRVVTTSTSETYGTAQRIPMDESHPLVAQSPYAASKIGSDKLAESFHKSFKLPVAVIRPFNVYGPRQSPRAVIPTIVCQALEKSALSLGATDIVRDYTFVTDTARAIARAAVCDDCVGRTFNFGSGKGIKISEIVKIVGRILGKRLTVRRQKERLRPKNSEVRALVCDSALGYELLGYKPGVDFRKGLEQTIRFFRKNLRYYEAEQYVI